MSRSSLHGAALLTPLALALTLAGCNDPPGQAGVRIEPEAPTTTDDLVLQVFEPSVDEQGHAITYQITWSRNGVPAGEFDDAESIPASATTRDEVWSVQVVPVDEKDEPGAASTAEITVLNTAPALVDFDQLPAEPTTLDNLQVSLVTEDVDGDGITASYAWTVDGSPAGTDSDALSSSEFEKGQVVGLTVTLDDGTDQSEHTLPDIAIGNTAPELASAELQPEIIRVADTVRVAPEGWDDPDGDEAGYTYAWTVSGAAAGTDATLAGAFAKGDTISCTITPFDGEDAGTPITTEDRVVQNTAPELAAVTLDPVDPGTEDDLTATATGVTDADGDPVTLEWSWNIDGRVVRTAETTTTTQTLPASEFGKGQIIEVTVTPTDGEHAGTPVASGTVTINNTAPVMSSVTLSPSPAYTSTDLVATASATDVDGDSLSYSYSWTVNGSSAGGSGSTLSSAYFERSDRVSVSVVALDGDDTSAALTAGPVTIVNTPPTDPGVSLSPSSPSPSDALTCTVSPVSTDADGDAISYTYTWIKDSSTYSTTTTSSTTATVPASATADGDLWACSVYASDGTDTSATIRSSTATVSAWKGVRKFTTCSATGVDGPSSSQCTSAYTSTTLAGEVSVSGGIQSWTVPTTGTYRIEAYGARGGGKGPGKGARVRGDFKLSKGDTLYLIVGQTGNTSNQSGFPYVGGGGGASWVYTSPTATTPLLVAAGGGGGAESCGSTPVYGGDGSATSTPTNTATSGSNRGTGNGAGGTGGNGGKPGVNVRYFSTGAGGAGWLTDGSDGLKIRSPEGEGGLAPRNGATGGLFGHATYKYADGGFGGGGGASDNTGAGGGGAGYNGGGGGNNYQGGCPPRWGAGGGGGSYNGGTNASATTGANSGAGRITIDLL